MSGRNPRRTIFIAQLVIAAMPTHGTSDSEIDTAYLLLLNGLSSCQQLSESSRLRLERLMTIWDRKSWLILSTGFTRHKPPFLDANGYPAMESHVAARELVARGVERSKILTDDLSSDTIGNIYFAMLLFVQPLNIRSISIVSSAFHMARVRAVTEWICSLSGWRTVPTIDFAIAQNPALSDDVFKLLNEKEAAGTANIAHLRQHIACVADMCLWLQMEHKAYSFDATMERLPEVLLQLY